MEARGLPQTPRVMTPALALPRGHGTSWKGEVQAGSPQDPEGLSHERLGEQIRGQIRVV